MRYDFALFKGDDASMLQSLSNLDHTTHLNKTSFKLILILDSFDKDKISFHLAYVAFLINIII